MKKTILLFSLLCISHVSLTAATQVVDDDIGVDDGSSPFATIQAAINAASVGDIIDITGGADNTHTEDNIEITQSVTIKGQGQSTTIIQAAATQAAADDGVFLITTNSLTVTFQDLTIQNGNAIAAGASNRNDGGGVYIRPSSSSSPANVSFLRVTITNNRADDDGGGIFIDNANNTVSFTDCVISNNKANITSTSAAGGGIANYGAISFTLTRCTVFGNQTGRLGGGIICSEGNAVNKFINCTISKNECGLANSTSRGAGLYFESITASNTIINCSIVNNQLGGTGVKQGGGFMTTNSPVTLINSIVANNSGGTNSNVNDVVSFNSSYPVTQTTSLVENCSGSGCPTFSYTTLASLVPEAACGVQSFAGLYAGSNALGNGTAPGGGHPDIPTNDICGNTRTAPHDIGAYDESNPQPKPAIVVDDDIGVDNGVSPFATIAGAMAAADTGDEIEITGGADNTHTEDAIEVTQNVTIKGQGQNTTIIQAAATQAAADDEVFFIDNNSLTVTFQDMTIQNGNAIAGGASNRNDGGGVYIRPSSSSLPANVSFLRVTITNNRADDDGGGIFVDNANNTVSFTDCVISNNEANTTNTGSQGGGINNSGAAFLTLTRCTVSGNQAGSVGGGIICNEGNAVNKFINCTISNNESGLSNGTSWGAGLYFIQNTASNILINCSIVNNQLSGTGSKRGGGFYAQSSPVTLINSIVADNSGATNSSENDVYSSHSSYPVTQTTSLVENCAGSGCTTFSYTSDPNLSSAMTCGQQTYFVPQSGSEALDNGTAPGGGNPDIPTTDICGTTRTAAHDIGSFDAGATMCSAASPIINTVGTHTSCASGVVGNFTYYCDCSGNLLLAVDVESSGAVIPINGVKVKVASPAAQFYNNGIGFIMNADGAVLMTRQWEVNPTTPPSGEANVRFFYPNTDFTAVNTELLNQNAGWGLNGVTDLEFYKDTDPTEFPALADISENEVTLYANGGAASTSTWAAGTHGSDHYAEYKVTSFSGGGGGAGGGGPAMGFGAVIPIPALGEWAVFLFFIGTLIFGLIARFNLQSGTQLATGGMTIPMMTNLRIPFDRAGYVNAVKRVLWFVPVAFLLIWMIWGQVIVDDFIGMAMAVPMVGYLVYLLGLKIRD